MPESYIPAPRSSTPNGGPPVPRNGKAPARAPAPKPEPEPEPEAPYLGHNLIVVSEASDAAAVSAAYPTLSPGIPATTAAVILGSEPEDVRDLAEASTVLAVVPGNADRATLAQVRDALDRLRPFAAEVRAVVWDAWRAGTPFRRPGTIETAGGFLAWLLMLPAQPLPSTEAEAGDDPEGYESLSDADLGIVDALDVTLENPVWLWPHRFLKGKINLIAGEGGDGKTTLAIAVAATVINGGTFPDGSPAGEPGTVLMLAAEDGAGDTIIPRFIAAGADVSSGRLKFCKAKVSIPGKGSRPAQVHPVSLSDTAYWRATFKRLKPSLLIIDPLPAYLGRGINDNKNSDVQNALGEFNSVIGEFGVCVIAITHTGKATDRKLIHKILGSVAYTNVARVVHVTVRDPDEPEVRYLERAKCNLDEPRPALAYRLASSEFERNGKLYKSSRAVFDTDPVAIDAEAMSSPRRGEAPTRGPDPKRETAAADWLFDFLSDRTGWTERKDIIAAAGAAGWIGKQNPANQFWSNLKMLYRAKDRVPKLADPRGGKRVAEEDMKSPADRYPRICWRLTDAETAF